MPTATVNGIETHYEVHGTGTPVLFIHGGWGGPASSLVPQQNVVADVLTDNTQLITYDRRSAGESQYVVDEFTVEDIAADARALLEHLGIERSTVIGHSMGGMVALQYALDYPEHVTGLCLAATGSNLMASIDLGRMGSELVERCRSDGDRAVFDSLKDQLRNPPPLATAEPRTPEMIQRLEERAAATLEVLKDISDDDLFGYWTGMVRNYNAFIGYDLAPRLGELKMPVLILHGNADTIVPFEFGKAMEDGIAKVDLRELDEIGHSVFDFPRGQDAIRTWVRNVRWL